MEPAEQKIETHQDGLHRLSTPCDDALARLEGASCHEDFRLAAMALDEIVVTFTRPNATREISLTLARTLKPEAETNLEVLKELEGIGGLHPEIIESILRIVREHPKLVHRTDEIMHSAMHILALNPSDRVRDFLLDMTTYLHPRYQSEYFKRNLDQKALDAFEKMLYRDASESVSAAARVLGKSENPAGAAAVLAALNKEVSIRKRMLLAAALPTLPDRVLQEALREIRLPSSTAPSGVIPYLSWFVRSLCFDQSRVRAEATQVLFERKSPEAVSQLCACIRDGDPRVRWSAVAALEGVQDKKAQMKLLQIVTSDDKRTPPELKRIAAGVLSRLKNELIYSALSMHLTSNGPPEEAVLRGLAGTKLASAQKQAARFLNDGHSSPIRLAALPILAVKDSNIGLPEIERLLLDPECIPKEARFAVSALIAKATPESSALLKKLMLEAPRKETRCLCIEGFQTLATPDDTRSLCQIIPGLRTETARDCLWALRNCDDFDLIYSVVEPLKNISELRTAVLCLTGRFIREDQQELISSLEDLDPTMTIRAARSLARLLRDDMESGL